MRPGTICSCWKSSMHSAAGSARHRLCGGISKAADAILAKRADPRFRLAGSVLAASSFARVLWGQPVGRPAGRRHCSAGLLDGALPCTVLHERAWNFSSSPHFAAAFPPCCSAASGRRLHADKILIGIIMLLIPGHHADKFHPGYPARRYHFRALCRWVRAILMAAVLALG